MKLTIQLTLFVWAIGILCASVEGDEIRKKDGTILTGRVAEITPGRGFTIQVSDSTKEFVPQHDVVDVVLSDVRSLRDDVEEVFKVLLPFGTLFLGYLLAKLDRYREIREKKRNLRSMLFKEIKEDYEALIAIAPSVVARRYGGGFDGLGENTTFKLHLSFEVYESYLDRIDILNKKLVDGVVDAYIGLRRLESLYDEQSEKEEFRGREGTMLEEMLVAVEDSMDKLSQALELFEGGPEFLKTVLVQHVGTDLSVFLAGAVKQCGEAAAKAATDLDKYFCEVKGDSDYYARTAAFALARLGEPGYRALREDPATAVAALSDIISGTLRRGGGWERRYDGDMEDALRNVGHLAAKVLVERWASGGLDGHEIKDVFASLIAETGGAAVGPLLGLLREDSNVRKEAMDLIGRIGPRAEAAVPVLCEALEQKDRYHVVRALAGIGSAAVPKLVKMLADGCPENVRAGVFEAFGKIREPVALILAELAKGLVDKDIAVRRSAGLALGEIGKPEAFSLLDQYGSWPGAASDLFGLTDESVDCLIQIAEGKELLDSVELPEGFGVFYALTPGGNGIAWYLRDRLTRKSSTG